MFVMLCGSQRAAAHLCAEKLRSPATSSTSDSASLKQNRLKSNTGTRALLGAAATAAACAEAPGVLASCTAGVMAGGVLLEVVSAPVQRINSKCRCKLRRSIA